MTITVSIPDPCLSPNARVHWAAKNGAKKSARDEAAMMARKEIGRGNAPRWKRADVRIVWYRATLRQIDADNALARCKATMDGIADAGVIGDDRGFIYHPIQFEHDAETPRLQITITEAL